MDRRNRRDLPREGHDAIPLQRRDDRHQHLGDQHLMRVLNVSSLNSTRPKGARFGFTLIELLVAMVIFGVVAGAGVNVMIVSNRSTSDQGQRIDMQQNIRAANAILPAEIRSLDAVDGDIKAMALTSLTIRASRQLAIICTPPVTGGALVAGVLSAATIVVRSP